MDARLPRTVAPGASMLVDVRGQNLAWSTLLIVLWRRASGEEYLWRVAF